MKTSIAESNAWGADLHIPIHTNAGGGQGTVVFVYNKNTTNMKFAEPIYREVQAVTPGGIDYGIRENPGLAELNSTNAVAVYVEADFHDNERIAKWLVENPKTVGEAICKGVCKAYGVEYKPQTFEPIKQEVFYRVQVGAYNSKALAEELLKVVKKAGFTNAFIVEVKK